jgi:hypothetical protein
VGSSGSVEAVRWGGGRRIDRILAKPDLTTVRSSTFLFVKHFVKNSVPDPWHFGVNPDPRIHASEKWIRTVIFVIDLQDVNKKLYFLKSLSAYYFLKLHLHHFS